MKRKNDVGALCFFCERTIGLNGKPIRHHVYGKANSTVTVPAHRECHRRYHNQERGR